MAELKRKPRLMDIWSLRLFADPINGSDKQPFMYFDFKYVDTIDGVEHVADPMIGINLRGPDSRTNSIKFVTDPATILLIMQEAVRIAEGRNPENYFKVTNTTVFRGQTRLETPVEDVGLVIARDGEGVFFGLSQYGREKVKFYFKPTARYMYLEHKDGSQFTSNEASALYAVVQANILREGYYEAMRTGYLEGDALKNLKAREKAERGRDFNQRQQQGGGQRPPQQQQYQQPRQPAPAAAEPPMDFDQDIPFAPIGLQYGKMSLYALA